MSNSFNLTKGSRFNLGKEAPGLTKVTIGLSWKPNPDSKAYDFDLDGSVFAIGTNGKIVDDNHFIFFHQLATPTGSIKHSGDNKKGSAPGDDESIEIDLSLLDPRVVEISFIVTIHEALERKQNFGQVQDSAIRLYNAETNAVISQYSLSDEFSNETAVQFGSLTKTDDKWTFTAIGAGHQRSLKDFVGAYTD